MFNKETIANLKKKIIREERNEEGNSLIIYILLMPVLVLTMGLGIDLAINTYTQNTLQSALDQATQSAVSEANNPTATTQSVSLYTDMKVTVEKIYDANRIGKLANLACQGTSTTPWYSGPLGGSHITPPSGCGYNEVSFKIVDTGSGANRTQYLTSEVVEYSKNSFLGMLGLPYQEYIIASQATITRANN